MSKDLNQDDVFNGAGAPEGVFSAQQEEAPRGGKGKPDAGPAVAKKGLSTKTYFIGGMVLLAVVLVWLKMPRSSDAGGEIDQMTGTEVAAEAASENVPEPGVRPMPSEILPVPAQQQPQVEVTHAGSPELETGLPVSKQVTEPAATSVAPPNPDAADLLRPDTTGMPVAAQMPAAAPAAAPGPMPIANVTTPLAVDGSELARVSRDVATLKAQVAALLAHKDDRSAPSVGAGAATRAAAKPAPRRASAGSRSARAAAKPEPATKPELPPVTGVSLRAVVGDSAWVMTSSGESKQVSAGDVIPGAGVVKSVNAASGTVNLADGRVLR